MTYKTPEHGSNINRKDIPSEYKWKVEHIFKNLEEWQKACNTFQQELTLYKGYKGQLADTSKLLALFQLRDKHNIDFENIYAYARLQQDSDTTDQNIQALVGKAENLMIEFNKVSSFIEPEINNFPQEVKDSLLKASALNIYHFYLTDLFRLSKHILPEEQESILAQSHLATAGAGNAFRSLVSADMTFPNVKDNSGKDHPLSEGSYLLNMLSDDRFLRENSFKTLMNRYHDYRNTLATTLTGSCRAAHFYATTHNYQNTLTQALDSDKIPTSLYDGLIDTVNDNLKALHEYIELKRDFLGFDEFHFYDLYTPITTIDKPFAYDFQKACEHVKASLTPLGEEYNQLLAKGIENGWIDIYENKGKRSGAYSWGLYSVHPFVLLNYQPQYNSISTLAHELGHAMHSFLSDKTQEHINSNYSIFCAEVASTTNEILLLEHTLSIASKEEKIYLLSQFLEAVRTTVYRQVQFAEFEKFIHSKIENGESLQAEVLENYWLDINKKYYGDALTIDQEIASEWSRIPHFYSPFYVYKYATGYSAATAFAASILEGKETAVEKYLGFLKAGGSDYSLNILKTAGVDLNTPMPVTITLKKFAEKLQELKTLLNK